MGLFLFSGECNFECDHCQHRSESFKWFECGLDAVAVVAVRLIWFWRSNCSKIEWLAVIEIRGEMLAVIRG